MLELLDGNDHTPRSALCEWDGFNGKSPNEQVLKNRLREVVRSLVSREKRGRLTLVPVNSLTRRELSAAVKRFAALRGN
jgi:hypothetical protein